MTQWLVTCLPHPLIPAVLPFEIFFADHSNTQTFDKRIVSLKPRGGTIENTPLIDGVFAITFDRFRL